MTNLFSQNFETYLSNYLSFIFIRELIYAKIIETNKKKKH